MKELLQNKIDTKTKPLGALGRLEELALKIGTIQNTLEPKLTNPTILVFAGDHGLTEEGVSLYPREVTFQMVMNFLNGGAAINVFCRQHDIQLKVVDAGVDHDFADHPRLIHAKIGRGTQNIMNHPAMTADECNKAIETGRSLTEKEHAQGCNIIGFGEMGIGNTSSASLIMHSLTGIPIRDCVGKGTGHDEEGLKKKTGVLEALVQKHHPSGALEILATYGGFEIAMMCGSMLAAREKGMILLIDGFIATSAFLVAREIDPKIMDNSIFCHVSDEKGHRSMLQYIGANALLDMGMRLGEGTGAAVAYPLIKSAINFLNEMASFQEAGVTDKE